MKKLFFIIFCLFFTSTMAFADWSEGDSYKMHYPQLPDPYGWDVMATAPAVVADDWRCTSSGPVSDIHLWGSWKGDVFGEITNVHLSIHKDIPAVGAADWSMPGELLWERTFNRDQIVVRDYDQGNQGWLEPPDIWKENDHDLFHQINITGIRDPFFQEEGTIYWLDVSITTEMESFWGWKTSLDHWNDDAVYWDDNNRKWQELVDPETGQSLDMAFVITTVPIPCTVWLLGSGLLCLVGLRRRGIFNQ